MSLLFRALEREGFRAGVLWQGMNIVIASPLSSGYWTYYSQEMKWNISPTSYRKTFFFIWIPFSSFTNLFILTSSSGVLWAKAYISCSILFCRVHGGECESVLYLLVKEVLTSASCMTYMGWFSWEQTIKFYSYTQSQYPTFWVRMGEDILQKMLLNINNKIALTLRFVSQLVEDQPLPVLGFQTVERG